MKKSSNVFDYQSMKIFIGADHAGFELKEEIKKYLTDLDLEYQDLGNTKYDINDDYPDFSYSVADAVAKDDRNFGILFCGSSFGACIVANKVPGIRAASVRDVAEVKQARTHDDVNIICIPGGETKERISGLGIAESVAQRIVSTFLETEFSAAARHRRRLNKIKKIEAKHLKE